MSKLTRRFWNWLLLGLGIQDVRQKQRNIDERLRLIEKLVDVGVDIHTQSDSWVVLCLAGKPEYVEFFSLPKSTLYELKHQLRGLERQYGRMRVDAPLYCRAMLDLR